MGVIQMMKIILLCLLFATSVYADLDKAVELAEQGKVKEGQLELTKIANAANDGDAKAQFEFGTMWDTEGFWLWHDEQRAVKWWRKSAEQDYAPAQLMMGSVYLGGVKVEKDLEKADEWFNKAIESDHKLIDVVNALKALAAEKDLDMSNLGDRLAVCSAKSLLLAAVLKNEKEYSEALMERSVEWQAASIVIFMTKEEMTQEDAENAYEKVTGDTALNSGIKEAMGNKPELIKLSEEIIYYMDKNCVPYDAYVERLKSKE